MSIIDEIKRRLTMRSYTILLDEDDAKLLKMKCRLMPITEENYIENLIIMHLHKKRVMTKDGRLLSYNEDAIDDWLGVR